MNKTSTNQNFESREEIFISELTYDSKSYPGLGDIKTNTNMDGRKIRLIVNGQPRQFDKGMLAHATSELIYDVSDYKTTHLNRNRRLF